MSAFKSVKNPAMMILEAGVNHEGDINQAISLVNEAAKSGADYIKFQTYTAERLAAPNSPSYWNLDDEPTISQRKLFSKFDGFNKSDYFKLSNHARKMGIGFMTTCFDEIWVDELESVISLYKIASADITNLALVKHVANKQKPILLSTGASTFTEIERALETISEVNNEEVCLMHCVLNYPTEPENANLMRIQSLLERFPNFTIGYSDHTRPNFSKIALPIAYALGARVFEKHFTLDKEKQGNDHYHSFNTDDTIEILEKLKIIDKSLEFNENNFVAIQANAREFARRGIYAKIDIKNGDLIQELNTIALRPTHKPDGIDSDSLSKIIGKRLIIDVKKGEAITSRCFSGEES
jgi:sialic acid synthase SpsE